MDDENEIGVKGMMVDPLYLVARAALLDALEALADQRDAVILVGAQAHRRLADGIRALLADGLAGEVSRERDVLVGAFSLPTARYPTAGAQAAFVNRLTARLHALPVVASHAIASTPPLAGPCASPSNPSTETSAIRGMLGPRPLRW